MSDATKTSEDAVPADQVEKSVPTPQEVAAKAETPAVKDINDDLVAHWKAMSRKNEDRAKENLEKLGSVEAENLRYKTALENAIPSDYLHLLTENDEESLAKQAETIKQLLDKSAESAKPGAPASAPVPSVTQAPQAPTAVSIDDQIQAAETAGNKALVAALKATKIGELSKN